MNEIIMYTDGSCLKNPDGPGGCAVILLYDKNGKPYAIIKWRLWLSLPDCRWF